MNAVVVAVLFFLVGTLAQDPPPSGANVLVTAHSSAPNSNVSDAGRVTNAPNAVISILNSNETASPNESSSSSSTASSVSSLSSSDVSTSSSASASSTSTSSSSSSASSSSVQSSTASSAASEGNVTIAANADVANVTAPAVEAKVIAPVDPANPAANVTVGAVSASSSAASTESSTTTTTSAPAETRKPVAASPDRNLRPVASGVPGLPQLAPKDQSASPFIAKGAYVKTSAVEKPCKENPDCYNLREPDEWCPLPERSRYSDKGCFCDHVRFVCTIQRQSAKGDDEYTDCAEKSTSVCAGYKPVIRVQQPAQPQPQPAQQQKQEKQEQRPQPKIKN